MPDITVILPAYNASKYIKTAINCIKNQIFTNFECIIIDDCSVDVTYELARKLTAKDKRFKILQNSQNLGQAKSRNLGLTKASGKYVIWLDADDWFDENPLMGLATRAEATKADITICNINVAMHKEGKVGAFAVMTDVMPVKSVFTLKELDNGQKLRRLAILRNELWNKLFRKEFLLKNHLQLDEKLRRSDDMDLSVRALMLADRISFVNKCLVTYNSQLSSSNQSTLNKYPCSVIHSLENIFTRLTQNPCIFRLHQIGINQFFLFRRSNGYVSIG